MKAVTLDHVVLTTVSLKRCLHFYRDILGLPIDGGRGRYSIMLGSSKINIHTRAAEFQPAASYPLSGSLDLCIRVDGDIHAVREELLARGATLEEISHRGAGRQVLCRACICGTLTAIL